MPSFTIARPPRVGRPYRFQGGLMLKTRFTELVGCNAPLQLAGMPGVGTPELVAAVANAGGLGMIGMPMAPAPAVAATLDGLRALTDGAIGFNQLMPFLDRDVLAEAARRVRVVELFWATPDAELIAAIHRAGAL